MTLTPSADRSLLRRADVLALIVLTATRVRIDTLAEGAYLPLRQNDVMQHPWLGGILPSDASRLLAQQELVDPVGLLLIVAALGCLLAYWLVSEFVRGGRFRYVIKLALIWAIVLLTVFAPSLKLALLRQASGPASYSHDGGVIQTEATIDYFLSGRNPYSEDYLETPMAEWGIDEFRTALYHYPYLPWTFIFSAPFKLLADATIGWFDERFVYLLLFAITLALAPGLAGGSQRKLLLLMALGLNPIMGSDLIYGQNDSFVLAWIVLSLWLWRRADPGPSGRVYRLASAAAYGLACASKPTAWFLLPFYLLLIAGDDPRDLWRRPMAWLGRAARAGWPIALIMLLVVGPYLTWDPVAIFDDVWRWSSGVGQAAYQIWGWGASNLVLAFGWVKSRFDYWPFWLPELLIGLPLLVALIKRQAGENTLSRALWGYGLWLFAFFFVSRFMNENYVGFITACLGIGVLADSGRAVDRPLAGLRPCQGA